eukprot:2353625-Rhodomonas_salina.1
MHNVWRRGKRGAQGRQQQRTHPESVHVTSGYRELVLSSTRNAARRSMVKSWSKRSHVHDESAPCARNIGSNHSPRVSRAEVEQMRLFLAGRKMALQKS